MRLTILALITLLSSSGICHPKCRNLWKPEEFMTTPEILDSRGIEYSREGDLLYLIPKEDGHTLNRLAKHVESFYRHRVAMIGFLMGEEPICERTIIIYIPKLLIEFSETLTFDELTRVIWNDFRSQPRRLCF